MGGFNYGGGKGDGTGWSSERGSTPEPRGFKGKRWPRLIIGWFWGARGGWAEAGPISTALIDAAISEAIQNGLPRGTVAATSTPAYKSMRTAIDNLPLDKQPEARMQAAKAWQKAHDAMPDKVTEARESGGGRNGHTSYYTKDNDVKKTQAQAVSRGYG